MLAERSIALRNVLSGSSGRFALASIARKAAISATDTAPRNNVCVEPHPALSASTTA